ncbi:OmpA family protein [Larkinella sp. VNQ87]|uniref:OmpA family protein n=1 Tax=Larkinella sp. VNQ87 TaxID=3400921 RepID=UPI003C0784C4
MKTYLLCSLSFLLMRSQLALAQIRVENPQRTAERSVEGRVNSRVDQGVNRGLDKVEEGIGNIFKKKPKKEKPAATGTEEAAESGEPVDTEARPATEAVGRANGPVSLKSYSKFDFVPGEKVIVMEDFSQDAVGDFPAKWNTNASGEVITIEGTADKWLNLTNSGSFYPEFLKELPENFTIEMDLAITGETGPSNEKLGISFVPSQKNLLDPERASSVFVGLNPTGTGSSNYACLDADGNEKSANSISGIAQWSMDVSRKARLSIWRQKTRLRVYLNEKKLWDIPRAFEPSVRYVFLLESLIYNPGAMGYALANLRVAVGAPDTRSKLITEGKLVTRGILFDVNSDRIKPESYGTLKEIASVLADNAAVRVRIIGHTDSDGDEASNLALSKKRAAAVKTALSAEFGIDAARMETDGRGEAQPSEPNTTAQGKANNRRVEFVKL